MSRDPLRIKFFSGDVNAGDLASPWLLSRISGRDVTPITLREPAEDQHYMCVGSTLAHADANTVVWGTGIMKPTLAPRARPLGIIGVRGPLTQARLRELGYGDVPVIGDGALSMARYYNPDVPVRHAFGLIPHYVDEEEPFCTMARDAGARVISAQQPLEPYLDALLSCHVIVTSSLHGLIFAHAYGLPAIWVRLSDRVVGEGFKFRDYYAFHGVEPGDIPLWDHQAGIAENLARATCPPLPDVVRNAPERLHDDLVRRGHV